MAPAVQAPQHANDGSDHCPEAAARRLIGSSATKNRITRSFQTLTSTPLPKRFRCRGESFRFVADYFFMPSRS